MKKKKGGAQAELVTHLEELGASLGEVRGKRMFGGHGLFLDGVMFALVADGILYFKSGEENAASFDTLKLPPFTYWRAGKTVKLSYRQAPEEALENARGFCRWAKPAIRVAAKAKK